MSEKKTKEGGEVSMTPPPGLAGVMSPASGIADVSAAALGGQYDDTVVPSEAAAQLQQPSAVQLSTDLEAQHSMLAQGRGAESSPSAAPSQAFPAWVLGATTRSLRIGSVTLNLPPPLEAKSVVKSGAVTILKGLEVFKNTVTAVVLVHEGDDGAPFVHPAPRGTKLSPQAYSAYLAAKNRVGAQLCVNLNISVQSLGVLPNVFSIVNVDFDASRAGTAFASVMFVCRNAHVGHELLKCAFENLPPVKGTAFEVLPEGSPVPEEVVKSVFMIDRAASGVNAAGSVYNLIQTLFNSEAISPDSIITFDENHTDRAIMTIVHKPTVDPLAVAVRGRASRRSVSVPVMSGCLSGTPKYGPRVRVAPMCTTNLRAP